MKKIELYFLQTNSYENICTEYLNSWNQIPSFNIKEHTFTAEYKHAMDHPDNMAIFFT